MKLYIVRHTKVEIESGICYGQMDVGVTNSFDIEKAIILSKLNSIQFDKIYSSPLTRCRILSENFNKVIYDNRLKELNFGLWEGMEWDEIEKSNDSKAWFNDYVNEKCPKGESFVELSKRIRSFINDLEEIDSKKNVLIICHAGVIRAFYSIINDIPLAKSFDLKVDYGQILEMTLNKE